MIKKLVYLDNAATTRTDPRVAEKMLKFLTDNFGNPSGLHDFSLRAKKALNEARETVAALLNCTPREIIFTGSGTESDNLAIFGASEANYATEKNTLLTTTVEHHAVLHAVQKLAKMNVGAEFLSPDPDGKVVPSEFEAALKPNILFASIIHANNEIGTINDVAILATIAREKGVIFHTDSCQAGGAMEINTQKLGVDLLTLNGSKINGPKGVGMLYIRKGVKIAPQIVGGAQEFGMRAGTENMAGIIGFAEALKLAQSEKEKNNKKLIALRDRVIDTVLATIPLSRLNGHRTDRLPNNANLSFLNTEGESLLLFLNEEGFAVNTGSACTSESLDPSHVLLGIGLPKEIAHGSLRITLGKDTQEEDIDRLLAVLPQIVARIRAMSPIHFTAEDFPRFFA